jgi:hypothetical protein
VDASDMEDRVVPSAPDTLAYGGCAWRVYSGIGDLGQRFDSSHVEVQTGDVLKLSISGEVGAGIADTARGQVYGSWSVRMRMSKGGGKPAVLLWPDKGKRPEMDFAEGLRGDAERQTITATYHPDTNPAHSIHHHHLIDYTRYHTYSVEWTATHLRYLIDGVEWAVDHVHNARPSHLVIMAVWKPGDVMKSSYLQVESVTRP